MTKGTKEWAGKNINFQIGCENDCIYCYAKRTTERYNPGKDVDWRNPVINDKKVHKKYQKSNKIIMFPSSHDVTENNVHCAIEILTKLAKAGNRVLVVTKPRFAAIEKLAEQLLPFKDQFEFRLTITSHNPVMLALYEPHAPKINERISCLEYLIDKGYRVSISMEPFLDSVDMIDRLEFFFLRDVSAVWIGAMNKRFCPPEFWQESVWGKEALKQLYKKIVSDPNLPLEKIFFKDSFDSAIAEVKAESRQKTLFKDE